MEEYLSTDIYVSKRNNSLINGKMIGRVLGVLLFIEAGMFVLCSGISVVYGESDYKYFLYTAGINPVRCVTDVLWTWCGKSVEPA